MNLLKGYIFNTFLGIILVSLWAVFVGPIAAIGAMIGWLLVDLVFVPFRLKHFNFLNVSDNFYYLAYEWQETWVHVCLGLDVPEQVTPQDKLFYSFKYRSLDVDHFGFHFLRWNVIYFEMANDFGYSGDES